MTDVYAPHHLVQHDDPIARMLKPPKGETQAEKARREALEMQAMQISQEIDAELQNDFQAEQKKRTSQIKALLLGEHFVSSSSRRVQQLTVYSGQDNLNQAKAPS